ncbi:uncharacterized protein F5Z01DRAFT_672320 [Emericellopsis atlantica]|uniref:Uncharacterized protein n=1 Tax=Emericellopsis atlantica TaxID=2614577 RepID=A0A9P7ZR64_9HYPO|nr:uncharacterized protein F5Z01DRAFT_672320 [Emericellopsis atlantica]KAG9256326.1 hypothetical protein F5Z01DRAFT_672320 [Emericellopsis atlantica]
MVPTGEYGTTGYRMAPRINLRRSEARLMARANDDEAKPYSFSNMKVPIIIAVVVPIVIGICVFFYLHRKNVKRQRAEDANDPTRGLDFGLDGEPTPLGGKKKKPRRSILLGGGAEKSMHKTNQLSMDMNLDSPYLLPPQQHGSQDSVHTLTRNYPIEYDPYRMVNSECGGSIRSFNKEGSIHGSKRASVLTGRSVKGATRQGSFPRTPLSPGDASPVEKDPFATPPAAPEPTHQGRATPQLQEPIVPVKPVVPEIGTIPYPDEKEQGDPHRIPSIQMPPSTVARSPEDRIASPPHNSLQFDLAGPAQPNAIGVAHTGDSSVPTNHGLGLNLDLPQPLSPVKDELHMSGADGNAAPGQAMTRDSQMSKSDYGDHTQPNTQTGEYYDDYEDFGRGRARVSRMDLEEQQQQAGLGVPQQDNKRLSVGFRPLPPDDALESEDPEYRANRIRSFYREYFDDSAPAPPMPNVPAEYNGGGAGAGGGAQYYEDYDDQYMGEAAYYDPDSNAFVMPYAQPVQRRAMTPPPSNRRGPPGPGPRGPPGPGRHGPRPHGPHGSVGGMSMQGGRPRAGSAAWGSRAPSSLGPRPDSSASARGGRPPKKNLPPPSALSTLPTPSKLRDDNFAIFNAADFAPPESFQSRARGRSQSPLGERREYSPSVAAASPLVSSYDELAAMPSPHMLRKSTTFTSLDFLPPKKFKDNDNQSDAGSIRSNRSGMSSTAMSAIRSGAGRVSRLPGDTVFTQQALAGELKPQWGMRP